VTTFNVVNTAAEYALEVWDSDIMPFAIMAEKLRGAYFPVKPEDWAHCWFGYGQVRILPEDYTYACLDFGITGWYFFDSKYEGMTWWSREYLGLIDPVDSGPTPVPAPGAGNGEIIESPGSIPITPVIGGVILGIGRQLGFMVLMGIAIEWLSGMTEGDEWVEDRVRDFVDPLFGDGAVADIPNKFNLSVTLHGKKLLRVPVGDLWLHGSWGDKKGLVVRIEPHLPFGGTFGSIFNPSIGVDLFPDSPGGVNI
jgi:hypothetical protein